MMRFGEALAVCCAVIMFSVKAEAEAHGASEAVARSSDEHTLIAIKEALVAEAQSMESQVVNTAWLDADGKLHESTLVQSGARVRGIQVQAYLDEMRKPKVEVALDEKSGVLPECFAKDDHLKRTVRVLPVQMAGTFAVDSRTLARASGTRLANQLSEYFEQSEFWHVKPKRLDLDQYTAMTTGLADTRSKFEVEVRVSQGFPPTAHQPERIPGSDPVSSFFQGKPSKFAEDWIRLSAHLIETATGATIWTAVSDFRIPVRAVSYDASELPALLTSIIDEQTMIWSEELSQYARCEPVKFLLTRQNETLSLDGGVDAGLRAGDQLLLLDETRIPARMLEPGMLAQLSLVEITDVEADRATLEYRAGAPISDTTGKVAIPF